jgi:hypothetical protein
MKDFSALTANEGVEFALFTKRGERLVVRGDSRSVPLSGERIKKLAKDGWRFSGHTHPGVSDIVLDPSTGDMEKVAERFEKLWYNILVKRSR